MYRLMIALLLFTLMVDRIWAAGPEDSVVRIFATQRDPNVFRPWTTSNPVDVTGSGVIIEGNRILTNAHVVLYATEVQVQPRRGGEKVEAKVEYISTSMDLAVLTIKDPKFFQKNPALARTKKLPKVQDNVSVYGFPIGGNDLSVTKGVVSRIDFGIYYSVGYGLTVQVSAAINPGNSGGPAVVGDKMIGIVFSRLNEQQNIGYVIPNEEIDIFLEDIKDGRYDGKPMIPYLHFQSSENKSLRRYLQLSEEAKGVLVLPGPSRPKEFQIQEFDLLTRIGDYDIDNDGMVHLPDDLRVNFYAVVGKVASKNQLPMTIIRKGKKLEVSLPVSNIDNRVISDLKGEKLRYFIHGPLVFAKLQSDALAWFARVRPDLETGQSPMFNRLGDRVQFPGEELVVVTSPLFTHKIAKGYESPIGQIVSELNGTKIKNLEHLVTLLRDSTDEFLVFRFAEKKSDVLVFHRQEMADSTEEIMEDNGIRPARRGSEDMIKVWNQGKGKK